MTRYLPEHTTLIQTMEKAREQRILEKYLNMHRNMSNFQNILKYYYIYKQEF